LDHGFTFAVGFALRDVRGGLGLFGWLGFGGLKVGGEDGFDFFVSHGSLWFGFAKVQCYLDLFMFAIGVISLSRVELFNSSRVWL
jgi:hypothetical protein